MLTMRASLEASGVGRWVGSFDWTHLEPWKSEVITPQSQMLVILVQGLTHVAWEWALEIKSSGPVLIIGERTILPVGAGLKIQPLETVSKQHLSWERLLQQSPPVIGICWHVFTELSSISGPGQEAESSQGLPGQALVAHWSCWVSPSRYGLCTGYGSNSIHNAFLSLPTRIWQMEISENLEKVSGLPFMVQRKRQNTGSVRRFFFLMDSIYRSEMISVWFWFWIVGFYITLCVLSHFSRIQLFGTLWTVARQALLSLGILQAPCPPPGYLPDPGIEPESLMSPALAGEFFTTSKRVDRVWAYKVYNLSL